MNIVALRQITRHALNWSIGLSAVMILIGLFAVALPFAASLAITVAFGWVLFLLGPLHLWFAWHTRTTGGFFWELLLSLLYLLTGIYLLMHPLAGTVTLVMLLGVYFGLKGFVEVLAAIGLRGLPGAGWMLFDGCIAFVLGILIWTHLASTAVWVLGLFVGISALSNGISRLFLSLGARRFASESDLL